ncbi:TRAP transporter small permease [uncultured Tateyamaria sp.]|nr:TRAP transporter small permease subunit [uncultured Tateyamaria sp.]
MWLGYHLSSFVLGTGQTSPTLGIPTGYVYLAPVIGFALLGLRFALSFIGAIDRASPPNAAEVDPA